MRTNPSSNRFVKGAAILLATVGIVSSLIRYLLPRAVHATIDAPLYGSFATEHLPVLAAHPGAEAIHRLGGAAYMILGLMQFTPRLRARAPALHRWSGRVFLGLSLAVAVSGVYMTLAFPFERGEGPPSVVFGGALVFCAIMAYLRIRRGDVVGHREWMTRTFAVGLGIGTIRLIAVTVLSTTRIDAHELITPAFWIGWTVTLLGAEVWIRAQRRERSALLGRVPGKHPGFVEGQEKLSYHPPPLGE